MYKQQGKYGDNRGLRPATTQGASDGFRLRATGGLEVQGREGWRSKREPLQISLESLFSDTSTVLVVLSFTCCFFYSPLSFFSFFDYFSISFPCFLSYFLHPHLHSLVIPAACLLHFHFHSCLPLFLFPSFCNISFVFLFYPVFLALDCFLSQTVFFSWLITGLLHLLNNSFSQSLFLAKLLSSFIPFVFFLLHFFVLHTPFLMFYSFSFLLTTVLSHLFPLFSILFPSSLFPLFSLPSFHSCVDFLLC